MSEAVLTQPRLVTLEGGEGAGKTSARVGWRSSPAGRARPFRRAATCMM